MEYQIRDINLADFGRKELDIAQQEMPGLMATRAKYGKEQPLKGIKIMVKKAGTALDKSSISTALKLRNINTPT